MIHVLYCLVFASMDVSITCKFLSMCLAQTVLPMVCHMKRPDFEFTWVVLGTFLGSCWVHQWGKWQSSNNLLAWKNLAHDLGHPLTMYDIHPIMWEAELQSSMWEGNIAHEWWLKGNICLFQYRLLPGKSLMFGR